MSQRFTSGQPPGSQPPSTLSNPPSTTLDSRWSTGVPASTTATQVYRPSAPNAAAMTTHHLEETQTTLAGAATSLPGTASARVEPRSPGAQATAATGSYGASVTSDMDSVSKARKLAFTAPTAGSAVTPPRSPAAAAATRQREEAEADGGDFDSAIGRGSAAGAKSSVSEVASGVGSIKVRVTRDGKSSVEEMDAVELARLYAQQQAALRGVQQQFDFLAVPDWVRLHPLLGSFLAEAIGTFAWVLTLTLTSVRNQSIFDVADDTNMTSVPIGFMLTSMVFTFGYISGGHFNPAVSLAVFLIGKLDLYRCVGYILCQVAAALGAGLVAMAIQGANDIFVPSVANSYVSSGIFSEMIYTFAVAMVVLNIAYSRQSGNFFYGFAVGMTVAAGSASVGRISGGAFNPAAATGLQVALCLTGECEALKSFWIYWLAPLIGSVVAAVVYSQMAQPTNTQVLKDHNVFHDVSQVHHDAEAAENEAATELEARADGALRDREDSSVNRREFSSEVSERRSDDGASQRSGAAGSSVRPAPQKSTSSVVDIVV